MLRIIFENFQKVLEFCCWSYFLLKFLAATLFFFKDDRNQKVWLKEPEMLEDERTRLELGNTSNKKVNLTNIQIVTDRKNVKYSLAEIVGATFLLILKIQKKKSQILHLLG